LFLRHQFSVIKDLQAIFIEGCIRNKQTIDEFSKEEEKLTKPYRIFITCSIYHVHCFADFSFHFCKIGTGYDPSSKQFLSRTKISIENEKGNMEARRRLFHEKSVDESSLSLSENKKIFPAISCKFTINHSS
jgi:hypothetical protein